MVFQGIVLKCILFECKQSFSHEIPKEFILFNPYIFLLMQSCLQRIKSSIIHGTWLNQYFTPILILLHDLLALIKYTLKLLVIFLKIIGTDILEIGKLITIFLIHFSFLLDKVVDVVIYILLHPVHLIVYFLL